MSRSSLFVAVTLTITQLGLASAQEPRFDLPSPEHALLERFAGEWLFERHSAAVDGSQSQQLGVGVVEAELVGDFFVVSRWSGNVYGTEYRAVQSLGYDVEQKRYTGLWIDSFLSFQWKLVGTVDDVSQRLTITTRGPAPTGGIAAFREQYVFNSADSITINGEMLHGETWVAITTTRLTRRSRND